MKNLTKILLSTLLSTLLSCINEDNDINNKGYNYTIIDTTSVSRNVFGVILDYCVIVEQDSSLYSAYMNTDGIITKLDRKLKVKK